MRLDAVTVILTPREKRVGAGFGRMLLAECIEDGTAKTDDPDNNIIGSWGELALAKHTNSCWSAIIDKDAPDVGFQYEVRATRILTGHLLLYEKHLEDKSKFPHVLAVVEEIDGGVKVSLRGWYWLKDGCHERFADRGRLEKPGFMVPQDELNSMSVLPDMFAPVPDLVRNAEEIELIHTEAQDILRLTSGTIAWSYERPVLERYKGTMDTLLSRRRSAQNARKGAERLLKIAGNS